MQRLSKTLCGLVLLGLASTPAACQTGGKTSEREQRQQLETSGYRTEHWEQYKENCEDVLRDPYAFDLARVLQCTKVWETYREVTDLSTDLRSMYATGFSRLYHEARGPARAIAKAALNRVCIPPHRLGDDGKVIEEPPKQLDCGDGNPFVETQQANSLEAKIKQRKAKNVPADVEQAIKLSKRKGLIDPKKISARSEAKLNRTFFEGQQLYTAGRYADAIPKFQKVLKRYAFHIPAKYYLARAYAQLNAPERAVQTLAEMYTWNSPKVEQILFLNAKTDPDLEGLRTDLRFKVMTGYRRTMVLNGAGAENEAVMADFTKLVFELQEKGLDFEGRIGADKQIRLFPIVYYRPIFKREAETLRTLIGSDQTRLSTITWDTREDFVIIWGAPEASALFAGDAQAAPVVQGERPEPEEGEGGNPLDKAAELKEAAAEQKEGAEGLTEAP